MCISVRLNWHRLGKRWMKFDACYSFSTSKQYDAVWLTPQECLIQKTPHVILIKPNSKTWTVILEGPRRNATNKHRIKIPHVTVYVSMLWYSLVKVICAWMNPALEWPGVFSFSLMRIWTASLQELFQKKQKEQICCLSSSLYHLVLHRFFHSIYSVAHVLFLSYNSLKM